jgi:hypothetical protein
MRCYGRLEVGAAMFTLAEAPLELAALVSLIAGNRDAAEILQRLLRRTRPTHSPLTAAKVRRAQNGVALHSPGRVTSWFESNGPVADGAENRETRTRLGGVSDASSETMEGQGRPYCLDHPTGQAPERKPYRLARAHPSANASTIRA